MKTASFSILIFWIFSVYSADYFPLTIGNSWDYQSRQELIDISGNHNVITHFEKRTILKDTIIGTDTIFISQRKFWLSDSLLSTLLPPDSGYGYYLNKGNDIYFSFKISPISDYYIISQHHPIKDKWIDTNRQMTYFGNATVPIGTFDSCFAVAVWISSEMSLEIYAPNVGLICTKNNSSFTNLYDYYFNNVGIKPKSSFKVQTQNSRLPKIEYFNLKGQRLFPQQIKLKNPNLLIKREEIAEKSLNR
jgi:hypothetical protein